MSLQSVRAFFAEKAPDITVIESTSRTRIGPPITVHRAARSCIGLRAGDRGDSTSTTSEILPVQSASKPVRRDRDCRHVVCAMSGYAQLCGLEQAVRLIQSMCARLRAHGAVRQAMGGRGA